MQAIKVLNQGLSFALELVMLGGYFMLGFSMNIDGLLQWAIAVGLAAFALVKWGLFVSPKAKHRLHSPWLALYRVKLMFISAMALYVAGHARLALIFTAGVLINEALTLAVRR